MSGRCYKYINIPMNWDQAELICNLMVSNLIKVNDLAEFNVLKYYYTTYSPGSIWVKFSINIYQNNIFDAFFKHDLNKDWRNSHVY